MTQEREKAYIVLVEDPAVKEMLVFHAFADTPINAKTRITSFYNKQDWSTEGIKLNAFLVRRKPMLVGHAYHTYYQLSQEIEALCTVLLDLADTSEQMSEKTYLYDVVKGYALGAQLIEQRQAQKKERKEHA